MIITIRKSQLFITDPAIRFAKEYAVPQEAWNEMWRRYKLLGYSPSDMRDYIFIKYARNLTSDAINRWIKRGEVYTIAKPLIKMGVIHVNSAIFKDYEEYVMNEMVKPLKGGAKRKPESVL